MDKDTRHVKRTLPVTINHGYVMAEADIFRTPDSVLIQITAKGSKGQLLAEFLEQAEPIGLTFSPIPVQNIREKRETH